MTNYVCLKNALGIKYHAMSIHDNVDAKDDGAQIRRFIEAADVINDILKQVKRDNYDQ